jgi:hypothetical protein
MIEELQSAKKYKYRARNRHLFLKMSARQYYKSIENLRNESPFFETLQFEDMGKRACMQHAEDLINSVDKGDYTQKENDKA